MGLLKFDGGDMDVTLTITRSYDFIKGNSLLCVIV